MTEFVLSLMLAIIASAGAAGLLREEWERTRCAYLTFEATHARLVGSSAMQDARVRIEDGVRSVRGTGYCGNARERVELPRLEGSP
jgi:hypothetical protein